MRESLGLDKHGAANLPHVADLRGGEEVISMPLGVHRDGNSTFSGQERVFNLYPGRITMSEEDEEIAKKWALKQVAHYPKEANYANGFAGVHSLVVRVEWGEDPEDPYEVDTEPSGYALLPHFSPRIQSALLQHRAGLGNVLWAAMPESRVQDSFEHASAPLAIASAFAEAPTTASGLVLPFMRSKDDLPRDWRSRSVFPVEHMEEKSHLISMGLFEKLAAGDDEAFERLAAAIEDGQPKVVRGMIGSCAVGLAIFQGAGEQRLKVDGKKIKGVVTKNKFEAIVAEHRERGADLMVRDFAPAITLDQLDLPFSATDSERFEPPQQLCAIKRYFVGFDSQGQPHVLGGMISARKYTALIHGANDSVNIVVDPPEKEIYASNN